ncbi:hypothetical protein C0993_011735 [Termitomyces sp. T159_Od127]|nr:hypothetical protein C0993_011735 [Termitomyces sp. T159_Od127]
MPTSAPSSPKNLLVDISTSGSSPMSASSDLGTHKLHPASPLIPGLPMPTPSAGKMKTVSGTQAWAFDVEDESHDIADSQVRDPLFTALKRSQSEFRAKPPADPMPLIQYDRLSSPPSPTQPLAPKLSTANPFAGLVDSFSSQTFISDRPTASSPSLPLTPSFPPGIELVSLKPTTVQSTPDLLDLSNDVVTANYENQIMSPTRSTQMVTFVDTTSTATDEVAPTHDMHTETVIDTDESVSDPFDDSHAINLATGFDDAWNSEAVPYVEESHQPPAELIPPLQSSELAPASVVPVPVSPSLLPSREPAKVEKPSLNEPESLASSWQWNGGWSPPGIPVSQSVYEGSSSAAVPLVGTKDEDLSLGEQKAGSDFMSFDHDHEESVPNGEAGEHPLRPAVELGVDISKEMDPADTWFTEEPTAVWDENWTHEKDVLLDMKGVEDAEVDAPQEEHINVLDELLAGPSEPIKVHVFEEMAEDTVSEQSLHQDSNVLETAIYSNDDNDVHEPIMPYSSLSTPMILAATPLPSMHATPSIPLSELPSLIPVASSPVVEECPDPDIMPLPDFPPSSVTPMPFSPVPVKPHPPLIHQAQTPTPPASPPPWSNSTARPSWSLRTVDASALGLPAATAIPPVPQVGFVAKPAVEVKADEADSVAAIDNVAKEDAVVEKVIEPPANELPREIEKESTMAEPLLPGPTLIPGSFPTPPKVPEVPSADVALSPSAFPTTDIPQTHAAIPASNRIRTLRSVIDIALTMQLRPGLSAGADPAWTVRFLMAVFGWFAILVSGDLPS